MPAGAGCFSPAIALAPLAIQGAEGVGIGATYLASNAAGSTRDPGDDPADRRERCGELEDAAPNVIELRQINADSAIQWRALQVANSGHDPVWAASGVPGSNSGWRPAENLLNMSFVPPLAPSLKPAKSTYVIYAPSEPQTSIEDDQLTNLTGEFGAGAGTFRLNGRPYQYSMVAKLPCFPLPVATK